MEKCGQLFAISGYWLIRGGWEVNIDMLSLLKDQKLNLIKLMKNNISNILK